MVHIDVKKLGRIPDSGGWRAQPGQTCTNHTASHVRVGYDYVHAVIDDRTRLAYAEVHPDERVSRPLASSWRVGFLRQLRHPEDRARPLRQRLRLPKLASFQRCGDGPQRAAALHQTALPVDQREGRALQPHPQAEWAYRQIFTSSAERTQALDPWLNYYITERIHTGIGTTPLQRASPT
jgi:hypothetical protein